MPTATEHVEDLTPRQIVEELDKYIIGQEDAKKNVAIALRNRWRRQNAPKEMRDEIMPNNIIMIGPTGVGKTEIARRLARLLVSEIQLYNQEEVEEGRRNNDVYERLKDDIDRSRQLYEERVAPDLRESTDYFYQELVRQLGAGDAKSLGI